MLFSSSNRVVKIRFSNRSFLYVYKDVAAKIFHIVTVVYFYFGQQDHHVIGNSTQHNYVNKSMHLLFLDIPITVVGPLCRFPRLAAPLRSSSGGPLNI